MYNHYPLQNTTNQHLKENNLYTQQKSQQFHHQHQSNSIQIRGFTSPQRKPSMPNTEPKINRIFQSPDVYINQLKGDVDCWELRYKSLEKKFSSMLILESEVESKNRELKDLHNKIQMERNQHKIVVVKLEDRLVGLEKDNLSLEEQVSALRLRLKVNEKATKENDIGMRDIGQRMGFNDNNTDEIQRKERQQQKQIQEYCSQIFNLQNLIENQNKSDQLEQDLDLMRQEKLKSQEFDALKQITKEKEQTILSQQSSIQELRGKNQHLVDSIEGVNSALMRRQEEFEQFKREVEREVESRICLMIDENDSLRQVISLKNQEQSLKNHYQKQFVNGQIENEINVENLNQKISVLESQAKQHQQQIQINDDDNQQNISRLLNQEYQRKQEEQYKCNESFDLLVGQLKQECSQLRQQGEDWKQNFILMNRQFHKKQEEIVLLQTEVEALNSLKLSICKSKSSFITKGLY